MPRETTADGTPRRKKTLGGANVDRFSPAPGPDAPKALNCVLSFEEALKLHLSLGNFSAISMATTARPRPAAAPR